MGVPCLPVLLWLIRVCGLGGPATFNKVCMCGFNRWTCLDISHGAMTIRISSSIKLRRVCCFCICEDVSCILLVGYCAKKTLLVEWVSGLFLGWLYGLVPCNDCWTLNGPVILAGW